MFQFLKTASALLGALLGFWLGRSVAVLLGFQSKIPFLLFSVFGASICAVIYLMVFYKLFQSKQATGKFDPRQLFIAALLLLLSVAALIFTLPVF